MDIIRLFLYINIVERIMLHDKEIEIFQGFLILVNNIRWVSEEQTRTVSVGPDVRFHIVSRESTLLHTQEFCEIILVTDGTTLHLVNGERQLLAPGSIVFVRPYDTHGFEKGEDDFCELVMVLYTLEYLRDISCYLGNDNFLKLYTTPALPPMFRLDFEEREKIFTRLIKISNEHKSDPVVARMKFKTLLLELFSRFFLSGEREGRRDLPEWLERLCYGLSSVENLYKGIEFLKKGAPCTYVHLCRTFKRFFGVSPTMYVNDRRLRYAAKLICETDQNIASICYEVGFKSLSYFNYLFKKKYGMSPGKFRKIFSRSYLPL
ncbi:MAG: hypothetical protein DRP92_04165 [Candidatus Neomarinimicrobiota bacterium]|nr:MAG: hypothetical protein DRP92_04165 [Candidatus Neomarinimicrobiota bacterium]